jgi:hypothetical protein
MPIIVVPEIFGTRLAEPDSGDLVWNPLGAPFGQSKGDFKADMDRLSQISAPLSPKENSEDDDADAAETRAEQQDTRAISGQSSTSSSSSSSSDTSSRDPVKHNGCLLGDWYDGLIRVLMNPSEATEIHTLGWKTRVYCAGYDWRQDNAKSALKLADVVDEALGDTNESKVVIVAHGMGGLVARSTARSSAANRRWPRSS